MTRVAIYEPDPRVCGPDSWAQAMRWGFREIGVECDLVTFTKSGKPKARWGRIDTNKSSASQSCAMIPDVVGKNATAWKTLESYDLVVLTDVKCAPHDKAATDEGGDPEYVEILSMTDRPWTSALHGRLYYEEHEAPDRWTAAQGSPHIESLMSLDNFSGVLAQHANHFDEHCSAIRKYATNRIEFPLPYRMTLSRESLPGHRSVPLASNGRLSPNKCHKAIVQALINLLWEGGCVFRGVSSVTYGPSYSFELYEYLWEHGFRGERDGVSDEEGKQGGVKSAHPWCVSRSQNGREVSFSYQGAYSGVYSGFSDVDVHLSVTDCEFSGGLLEFATLESIDAGCVPLVTRPFAPHYTNLPDLPVIEYAVSRVGTKWFDQHGSAFTNRLADQLDLLFAKTNEQRAELAINIREQVERQHDPRILAKEYVSRCL